MTEESQSAEHKNESGGVNIGNVSGNFKGNITAGRDINLTPKYHALL